MSGQGPDTVPGRLTLVLGGVRSGKSRFAEQLAGAWPPVTYLATAHAGDDEMAERIARHRLRRPADWETVEAARELPAVLGELVRSAAGCVLVDCLPLWLTGMMLGLDGGPGLSDEAIGEETAAVLERIRRGKRRVVAVSGEVGWGLLPMDPLARRFTDLLGEMNQRFAAEASEVHACIAGIPVRVK